MAAQSSPAPKSPSDSSSRVAYRALLTWMEGTGWLDRRVTYQVGRLR
jgi:hypothetical protein